MTLPPTRARLQQGGELVVGLKRSKPNIKSAYIVILEVISGQSESYMLKVFVPIVLTVINGINMILTRRKQHADPMGHTALSVQR